MDSALSDDNRDIKSQGGKSHSLHVGLYESERFEIDLSSLTKHAIILGATGSGKTVLAKVIVEEAALKGIPTFAIDPKGDIGNLAFKSANFDFSKWCGKEADALKIPRDEYASSLKKTYAERAREFGVRPTAAAEFAKVPVRIFTPKSASGLPAGISPNLTAPENFAQLLLSDMSSAADLLDLTAYNLLRLAGYGEGSRKEITFVSALLENSWKAGKSLSIRQMIREIENPPVPSIGSMHVSDVLSDKERHNLATRINLLVSDPKLRSWSAAEPFDFSSIFASPPSINVLDLRNIQSEQEKQLFVEIVLQQLFQWLIKQGSAQTLRYLLYFDEIAGYCPPVREPPSKKLLLLLIKQARAFGLGLVLASQNAVDLDYKVISNANVRFIGRLGAQRDIQRVSVGLELDTFAEKEIARLRAGEFFCNIFDPKFRGVVRARWPLTYHRGPLENSEITELVAEFRKPSKSPEVKDQDGTGYTLKAVESEPADLEEIAATPTPRKTKPESLSDSEEGHPFVEPEAPSEISFLLLDKKFEPSNLASFIRLGNNVKELKVLSVEPEEVLNPVFRIELSVYEKTYSKQSLEKTIEVCAMDGGLVAIPESHSVTFSRHVSNSDTSNAAKWNAEVTKLAKESEKELATKFDILIEEKRNENIASRSEKPKSRIAELNAKQLAAEDAIKDDEAFIKSSEKLCKEYKKEKKSKARIISLENKIELKRQKMRARQRDIDSLKANRKAQEELLSEIAKDEEEKFHKALPNVKSKMDFEVSGWLVETFYRAQVLINNEKEHYGDIRWSSYSGQGTWGRCSACSVALVEGSACSCGNLLCHSHLAYCKECLEPACKEHRRSCNICNSVFCAAHSAICEICRLAACLNHGGTCEICSRKVCVNCSKRRGMFKRELVCVDCSAK